MNKGMPDYGGMLSKLSKIIPMEEIKKDYIFLSSNKYFVGFYEGIKIYTDSKLPPNTIYLMRKEDYERK